MFNCYVPHVGWTADKADRLSTATSRARFATRHTVVDSIYMATGSKKKGKDPVGQGPLTDDEFWELACEGDEA
jgi:hypothetical protein